MHAPSCSETRYGHATLITIGDELDEASSADVTIAVERAAGSSLRPVIVSLEHCSHCSPSGLRMLVRASSRLHGRLFLVVPPKHHLRGVLEHMGISPPSSIARSSIEALMRSSNWNT